VKLRIMSIETLDVLSCDVVDYLEGISDPEKVRLSKRWDKDKDHQTYGLSASDYTPLYHRFNPRFNALTHDQRLRPAYRRAKTSNAPRSIQRPSCMAQDPQTKA
jgi:hypothetical protein